MLFNLPRQRPNGTFKIQGQKVQLPGKGVSWSVCSEGLAPAAASTLPSPGSQAFQFSLPSPHSTSSPKWKVSVSCSVVSDSVTVWAVARDPLSVGFSRKEYWNG